MNLERVAIVIAVIVYSFVCAGFCAFLGKSKRRDTTSWFVLGLFFGIFALLAAVGAPFLPSEED